MDQAQKRFWPEGYIKALEEENARLRAKLAEQDKLLQGVTPK